MRLHVQILGPRGSTKPQALRPYSATWETVPKRLSRAPKFSIADLNSSIEKLISNEKDWKIFENKRSSFFKEIFPTGNQKTYNQLFLDTVNRYL